MAYFLLERIHDNRALNDELQDADFLRKSALKGCAIGNRYREFAATA
jgi:hypothetical protein